MGGSGSRGYGRVQLKELTCRFRPLEYYTKAQEEIASSQGEEELMVYAKTVISALE